MNYNLKYSIIVLSCLYTLTVFSQSQPERCSTVEYEQQLLNTYPFMKMEKENTGKAFQTYLKSTKFNLIRSSKAIITIPVVFHIVGDNAVFKVTQGTIDDQLKILNEDYRKKIGTNGDGSGEDTKIEFCLASESGGITTNTGNYPLWNPDTISTLPNSDEALKSIIHWPPNEYLNVYITELCCGTLGYSSFPYQMTSQFSLDGVVIDPDYFGYSTDPLYNAGRTLTHEVGHWLGLEHVWGNGDCSVDDGIDDTPICMGVLLTRLNKGCPEVLQCELENSILGSSSYRPIENYMDYSDVVFN